jgi:uncharacterized membrane protein (DUF2068 family)
VARHVEFLSRLLYIWSAFTGIAGLALVAFSIGAASLAVTAGAESPGTEVAAGVTAATLAVVALTALAWAGVHYLCARGLWGYRPWARSLGLALGLFDLPLVPLGTGLGAYALWVLLQEDTRRRFGAHT